MMRAKPLKPDQKQILARLNCNDSEAGSVARFVPIDDEQGVKLYTNRKMRNLCYERQSIAYNHDFGPKCWHPFTFKWIGVTWHGFFTERVIMHPAGTTYEERDAARNELRAKILKTFTIVGDDRWVDMHPDNWGRTKDGRNVAIDFSHFEDTQAAGHKVQPSWRYKREDNRYIPREYRERS